MLFANKAAFLEPRRVVEPLAWAGHIPFAFWLIEAVRPSCVVELGTHTGNSFCAFAQAMEAFGVAGRVYAIDHWRGDEHAGAYTDTIYEELSRYVATLYPDTASMVRSTFDDALGQFKDRSIDVLHIDGLHTYDAVKHDFVTWLPKLTDDGIVLLHDTAVTTHEFGVGALLRELAADYRTYNFLHSHGLGVVAIGKLPDQLSSFFEGAVDSAGLQASTVFERLGNGILERAHAEAFAWESTAHGDQTTHLLADLRTLMDILTSTTDRQNAIAESRRSPYSNTGRAADMQVNRILSSGYFSPNFYRPQIDASEMDDRELCLDYLLHGEANGLAPSLAFDPAYYALSNPDVVGSGYGMLEHFVLLGWQEGRLPVRPPQAAADEKAMNDRSDGN